MKSKLYRKRDSRVFAGVCSGIGDYLDVDPVFVRLLWIFFALCAGCGLIAYILAIFIIPCEDINRIQY